MSLVHLYDTTTGPPGVNGGFSGSFELGSAFSSSLGVSVEKLGWYATNTTTTDKPSALTLWDGVSGASLATTSSVTHNGSVGWQWSTLSTPIVLAPGERYVVSLTLPTGAHVGSITLVGAAPTPLAWSSGSPKVQSAFGGGGTYPNSASTTYWWVDVEVNTAGGGGPGAGPSDTGNALVAWLADTSDNTHRAGDSVPGLPDITRVAVDAVKTVVDNIPQVTDAPWVDALKLWQIAGALSSVEIAAWNLFAQRAPGQLTGGSGGGGSAFFASGGRQVAQAASDTLDVASLLLALRRNALVDFPGSPWVMADETTFDTDIAYAQEADLYAVTFSSLGSNIVNTVAAGVDISYRLAWWTPLIGAFGQQRRFIDTPSAHLWLDGTRLPGVLLHSPAGAAGTIQAWLYA